MTDLAERNIAPDVIEDTAPTTIPSTTPDSLPPDRPPRHTGAPSAGWPFRAKVTTAVLAVAALLGGAGTIIGFTSGDGETDNEQQLESTIETLTAERDDVTAERDAVTAQRDDLAGQVTELESTLDTLATDREDLVDQLADLDLTIGTLTTERDDLAARLAALDATAGTAAADRDALAARLTELDATIEAVTAERDALTSEVIGYESTIAALRADLITESDRAVTAEAERDVLADLFPITFDASLDGVSVDDLAGEYDVDFDAAFCSGFTGCGTDPAIDELTIEKTSEGFLRVEIDNLVDAGLYRVDGALYAVAESSPDIAACGSTPRVARVAVTIFAHGISVGEDAAHEVTDLGASLTIQSAAGGTCGAGLAFYGSELTPQS